MNATATERLNTRPEGRRTIVPVHLPLERAWRWCLMATLRDLRVSVYRRRAISLPNLRRLFLRRWAGVCWANQLAPAGRAGQWRETGVAQILAQYHLETRKDPGR